MAFEQNQQDQFNLNNNIDQLKQWHSEADKATAAIRAADLEAEEELLGVRLKNLSKAQQTKLIQLKEMLDLEEKGIQALDKLKLTLSNRQLAVRKKEIQKEFQLYKAAAEEFFKTISSSSKPVSAVKKPSSTTDDIKASAKNKPVDSAIQKADRKVQSATYGVDKVGQDITDAIASIQEMAQEAIKVSSTKTTAAPTEQKPNNVAQKAAATDTKPEETRFSADAGLLEKIDIGHYSTEAVLKTFESLKDSMSAGITSLLDQVTTNNGQNVSQDTVDFAGGLLESYKEMAAAEETLAKFKKDGEEGILNRKLLIAEEEHKLRKQHAVTEKSLITNILVAESKAKDLEHNEAIYLAEEESRLRQKFADTQNQITEERLKAQAAAEFAFTHESELLEQESYKLRNEHEKALHSAMLAGITARAKANDIIDNKNLYLAEAADKIRKSYTEEESALRLAGINEEAKANYIKNNEEQLERNALLALENDLAKSKNQLAEELLKTQAAQEFALIHEKELLEQEGYKLRNAHEQALHKTMLANIVAQAKAADIIENRNQYLAEAHDKLTTGHTEKQNQLKLAAIDSEAKANDLINNRQAYELEARIARENAYADEKNRLTEDLYKAETSIAYTKAHTDELLAIEHQKLINEHAVAYDKYLKDILAADAKAKDLEHNRSEYLNEELDNLERGHKQEQNRLTQDLINAEAKGIDLKLNKELYLAEEASKLRKAYTDEENKLIEEAYKRQAKLDYINANEEKLLEQELAKLRGEHADEEITRRLAHIKALARSTELEKDRQKLLEDAKQKLADEHTNKQNDLKQGAIDNEAKAADLQNNREQYILEARLAHENAFYAEKNRLEEESIQVAEGIAWDKAHLDEVMAQEVHKKQLGYTKAYGEYQKKAGKFAIDQAKFEKEQANKANKAARKEAVSGTVDAITSGQLSKVFSAENRQARAEYLGQRTAELQESGLDETSAKLSAQFELLAEAAGGLQAALDVNVEKISGVQGFVDTRLQGSQENKQKGLSYWKQLLKDVKGIAGASPFIKQEKFVENVKTLVDRGISFDIKQRAFLMTVQEKIANTFNVADGTLLRLIRIQQQDTTAGRLGMESALNSFLNSMYETSEYLSDVAGSVRSSLEEMQALMEGAAGTELEYQVQKWMGSLYSVGMSQNAVQSIAQTFGQIASGDVSGLTGSGTGNLLIMAANEAGMSIADILQDGLNADDTNKLMQAMVNYLAEIAETSSDSKVVQQQLANVYGIKASDLKAATNLASSVKDVSKQNVAYSGMLKQLEKMMNTIRFRTSISEGMTNMWDNVMYSMASTQASNPILYALPKMANMLRDFTGGSGIDIPFINVMGFGVDLNMSVADIMSIASMAGTALGALGPLLTGMIDLVNPLVGSSMLKRAGIKTSGKVPVLARGSGATLQNLSGASLSESGYVGNSSGEDVKNATMQEAEDSKKKQMVEAKEDESADDVVIKSQQAIIDIYNLLEEVAHGSQSLRVRVINNIGCGGSGGTNGGSSDLNSTVPNDGIGSGGGYGKDGTDNGNWVLTF